MNNIRVTKRNGVSEPLDYNKIHFILEEATEKLSGVSVSDIEMNASLQFYDGIKTTDIHEILIRSANELIAENTPNYETVAARLINYNLRKMVFGDYITPSLLDIIHNNVTAGVYDPSILEHYTREEIVKLDSHLDHNRDELFKSAGLQQCIDKYLLKDRASNRIFETPQYMYMLIAMTIFREYSRYGAKKRIKYVKAYYDAISKFEINIPTPIMCGVRTRTLQYSSCVKIDIGDDMGSITHSDSAIKMYTSQRAGIGINAGRIRTIGSKIRDGEVVHTGVIPFLKCFEASVKCCTQNGVRGGSATVHFPYWHGEIEDIIVLKNNKGTEDSRVRRLDYSIQLNRLFYRRVMADENITLFSPHNVPGLYESMGDNDRFEELYAKCEKDASIVEGSVNARTLLINIIKERIETGRIYLMNLDHCNTHSSFLLPIYMSNLCQEITLPTKPIRYFDDPEGEIALCILSAINLGKVDPNKLHEQMRERCDLAVRALDELIDIQEYPLPAARAATLRRRSLGIGYIGLAHFFAKNKVLYGSQESIELIDRVTESLQYHLIKASIKLAEEKGPCEGLDETKYGHGILPIDTYAKGVDSYCTRPLELDWDGLRVELKTHGIRNSTLTAQMPSESSSVVSNETNGIEVPRDVVQRKKSKLGILKMMVPEYRKCKEYYTFAYDKEYSNDNYMKVMGVIQKYFDQAISVNQYCNPEHYPDNKIPVRDVMRNLLLGYTYGMKTAYYLNTYDGKEEQDDVAENPSVTEQRGEPTVELSFDGCDSGACAI